MARAKNYEIGEEKFIAAIANLEEGGTKKRSCEILGVGNNKTMERLISEFLERKELDRKMRSKKRKEPILPNEVVDWITDYLQGSTFSELSDFPELIQPFFFIQSRDVVITPFQEELRYIGVHKFIPGVPSGAMSSSLIISEDSWRAFVGDEDADEHN